MTSPTYLLDNAYEYLPGHHVHHIDLYRLPTNCDLSMLGIPEIFETSVCLVEWPQRLSGKFVPNRALSLNIRVIRNQVELEDSQISLMKDYSTDGEKRIEVSSIDAVYDYEENDEENTPLDRDSRVVEVICWGMDQHRMELMSSMMKELPNYSRIFE